MGLKTHSKAALVVRREGRGLRRYVHIGTGNYNQRTARTYEDLGLFSCDDELGADLSPSQAAALGRETARFLLGAYEAQRLSPPRWVRELATYYRTSHSR